MSAQWTVEQVIALAPDDSSLRAGRDLAQPGKWVTLGRDERSVWGEIKGSGKNPYQARIDLTEPAFKCSCPSRKFPCKHALGLFLVFVEHADRCAAGDPPEWVSNWLAERAGRAERRSEKEEQAADGAPTEVRDVAAQKKRVEQREAKVSAGLAELSQWLRDLVRQGLSAVQHQPRVWSQMAARLVDAQAPAAARLVRECDGLAASGPGWEGRLLRRLASLHLLTEGFVRLASLPTETQADVRALIGFPQSQEEILAGVAVSDTWGILGQRIEQEEQLRVQRTWLWGVESGRPAMILNFAAANQALDTSLIAGRQFRGELAFYPGAAPLRAIIKHREDFQHLEVMPGFDNIAGATQAYADVLARNPWQEVWPFALRGVRVERDGDAWFARDEESARLPLAPRLASGWKMLAISGGGALDLFGEWDDESLQPVSAWHAGRLHMLVSREVPDAA